MIAQILKLFAVVVIAAALIEAGAIEQFVEAGSIIGESMCPDAGSGYQPIWC